MSSKFLKVFEKANIGEIVIHTPEGKMMHFKGSEKGPICDFTIKDWKIVNMIIKRGDIGLGEAYMNGLWESTNLDSFLTYCALNLDHMQNYSNPNLLNRFFFYFYNNFVRLNTKYGSRKNILEHYDIGNDFYKLWLDPTMTYSSAICQNSNETLEQAQINKYKRIIDVLDVGGAKVLEIGSGWGGFATQASQAGAQVTGITISDQQYDFSTQKLEGRAQVLKQDYRDIQGVYDRIVSIEMFEAVGEKYWPLYFQKIRNSLVKGGRALIQTITIADDVFHTYRKSSDYIRHYVFPGGMLPSKSQFIHQVHRAGMDIGDVFEFGQDYAWTLKEWNTNFMRIKDTLLTMDYSPQFLKAWEFYLNLCIAGFQAKRTNVMQIEIVH